MSGAAVLQRAPGRTGSVLGCARSVLVASIAYRGVPRAYMQGRRGMERNGSVPGTYREMERSGSSCQEVCASCRIDQVLEISLLQGRLRQQ